MPKPSTKADAIRLANAEQPGMTNAKLKAFVYRRWKLHIDSNQIFEVLGAESTRRDARSEQMNMALARTFLSRIGDYRTCLRLLRSLRKEGGA